LLTPGQLFRGVDRGGQLSDPWLPKGVFEPDFDDEAPATVPAAALRENGRPGGKAGVTVVGVVKGLRKLIPGEHCLVLGLDAILVVRSPTGAGTSGAVCN